MFLIPTAAFRFIKEGRYNKKQAVTCNTIGLIGTFAAFFLVTNIPIYWLKWLITLVLVYTSVIMLRDARRMKSGKAACAEKGACEAKAEAETEPEVS